MAAWTESLGPRGSCASRDRCDSGIEPEPTLAVAGGSSALPNVIFSALFKPFLGLFGTVSSGMRLLGLFIYIYCFCTYIYLSAAAVTGARVLHGPSAPVTYSAPVACFSSARSRCVDSR